MCTPSRSSQVKVAKELRGISLRSDGYRGRGRLLIPRDILGFEEVVDPADIEP
jgi:hypothetical protein